MRFRPLQHTLASLARVRGRQPSDRPASSFFGPCPATPLARLTSPGLVLLEPPGGHWAVRVLPMRIFNRLPARGTCLINPDRHCCAALSVTNSTRSGPSFERFGRSLRGLAGPGFGSDGAPGVRALRSVAPADRWRICYQLRRAHLPLTSRSPGSFFTRRSPPSSVKPPLKLTRGGRSQAHPFRLLGFGPVGKPCRRGDCPHKRPVLPWAWSSLRSSGIHQWMRRRISMRRRPTVPGPPLPAPFRSWASWQVARLLTDVPHSLLLPVTS